MKKALFSFTLALAAALSCAAPARADGGADAPGTLRYDVILEPIYEDAEPFSEGRAAVRLDGLWGYIDTEGTVVVPFRFEKAYDFSEGLAVVSPNVVRRNVYPLANGNTIEYNYYDLGFIDGEGNYTPFVYTDPLDGSTSGVVVPDEFSASELVFHNGYVLVDLPELGGQLFDTSGRSVVLSGALDHVIGPMNEGLAPAEGRMEGAAGWVDGSGNVVKMFSIDYSTPGSTQRFVTAVLPFNQGLAPVWQCVTDPAAGTVSYLLGFMDRQYRWVIQPQFTNYWRSSVYTDYEIFGETGLAMVAKDGRFGAVDKSGNTVIPFEYEILGASSDGLIPFCQGGKYGYLDAATNQVAIPARYISATMFLNGMAVVYDGYKAFLIDRCGVPLPGVDELDRSAYFQQNEDSTVVVHSPGEYVVIRRDGKCGFGRISYTPPLPDAAALDAWALPEVSAAIEAGLVPVDLQCLYRNAITRAEFCELVVRTVSRAAGQETGALVAARTGRTLDAWRQSYPFSDATDSDIIAASALGIVNGRDGGVFDPYSGITRQEAALMLTRAAGVLGADVSGVPEAGFADGWEIAPWARGAVDFVFARGVMNGTGGSAFSPLAPYTREQSYLTALRLYQSLA